MGPGGERDVRVSRHATATCARPQPLRPPPNPGEFEYAFWFQRRVDTGRFFGGAMQRAVVERFGGSMTADTCGRRFWPMLRALLP